MECENKGCPYFYKGHKSFISTKLLKLKKENGCYFGFCKLQKLCQSALRSLGIMLLIIMLVPVSVEVNAAETENNYEYSKIVDEYAGMSNSQWFIQYMADFKYKFELGIFGIGERQGYKKWNINKMYYSFDLNNIHEDVSSVGTNITDLNIVFEYTYLSLDDSNSKLESSAAFTYKLSDYYEKSDTFDLIFEYVDILSGCVYYQNGNPTVIKSVSITIQSPFLKKCGTSVIYEFSYQNDDIARSICEGISCYTYNSIAGKQFVSDTVDIVKNSDTDNIEIMYTVLQDSTVDLFIRVVNYVKNMLKEFPKFLMDVITGFLTLFVKLPTYLTKLIPFMPEYIVTGIVYCLYFILLISLFRLIFKE